MHQIMTKFVIGLAAGLLVFNVSVANEVVYLKSAEPCLVTVYPAPDATPLSEKLNCGEKASLLERQGRFVRVQVSENRIVWIADRNIAAEAPAEQEVVRLLEYQKKIEAELASLNDQVSRLSEKSSKLISALIAAEASKKQRKEKQNR
ncbi:hypothetical protein BMS3Bbin11_00958 [bacterium BMS3Bbin11]|nr:hypothetical protein BMS3Abin11_02064 [bacterium BMS3Abin11]GBE45865.1 hypothetical protein BMS3Bbin11_00958 [bacterium BMS3Bbin11]GMT39355.1 MAG: hypothetical protein IEMM0001_0090 [bacterium]